MEIILFIAKFGLAFIPLSCIAIMIFLERKGASIIQDRVGPNRAAIKIPGIGSVRGFGMIHNISDSVKLFFKEDFLPKHAHKWYYILAPMLPLMTAILTPALIPWFAPISLEGVEVSGAIINANSGLLMLFALGALSVYGVVIGSWASHNKYSLLGGMRASAMMISYEVSMGLSVVGLLLLIGSFNMTDIVEWQAANAWGVVVQPVGCLLFIVSMFAETGRTPFCVSEGESEIVGGFHTEYSSIRFALFFMGEYAHIVIASALIATLFFGGYHLPGLNTEVIHAHTAGVLAGLLAVKALMLALFCLMTTRQKKLYGALKASDKAVRLKEYSLFQIIFGGGALVAVLIAAVLMFIPMDGLLSELLTAAIQISIVMAKTMFFCWVFVWVRWTVPRFRYDHIMALGWKVMLNVALVNLVITAIVYKLLIETGVISG